MRNLFFTPSSEAQEGLYTEYNITKTISNPRRKRRKHNLLFYPDEGKKKKSLPFLQAQPNLIGAKESTSLSHKRRLYSILILEANP